MFTVEECRVKAAGHQALAVTDPKHRRKHLKAAEAWLFLASKLNQIDSIGTFCPTRP